MRLVFRAMSIHILPPEVIEQIAAGEVVERPSHLVKELVENSLDAGSTEIEVEYEDGGRFVKVKDNGKGISKSELGLALARHATSKIDSSDDLWKLSSHGFRGEALASISAVSKFTITSRPKGETAQKVVSEFGQVSDVTETGGDFGTLVQVEELFGSVPARLKFLKSDSAEGTQIKNTMKALALAYPRVSFRVRSKGKLVFFWPSASSHEERACQVLEKDKLYSGEFELEGMKAKVSLAAPNDTTGNSRQIWLFAQNRWIQDRSLQAAIMDGFRSLLMHGEFPFITVWLSVPPEEIDINIHPTKSQVKFLEAKNAFRVVQRAVREILEKAPWVGDALSESPKPSQSTTDSFADPSPQYQESLVSMETEGFSQVQYPTKNSFETWSSQIEKGDPRFKEDTELDRVLSGQTHEVSGFETVKVEAHEQVRVNEEQPQVRRWSNLQVLGQAHRTYIVTQNENSLILVDQHAAHERVVYETLMSRWQDGEIDIQSYLIPLTVDLNEESVEA